MASTDREVKRKGEQNTSFYEVSSQVFPQLVPSEASPSPRKWENQSTLTYTTPSTAAVGAPRRVRQALTLFWVYGPN